MKDKELIDKVWKRIFNNCHLYCPKHCYLSDFFNRVTVRYVRRLQADWYKEEIDFYHIHHSPDYF